MVATHDENCIFCQIIEGKIPSTVVYEDDAVMAFLDITQATKGHTLLVPKTHVKDIFGYDEALAAKVFARLPKLASAIKASDDKIVGLNIVNNNGEAAYQSVFHSHIHLIPRYSKTKDGFSMTFSDNSKAYNQERRAQIAAKIKANL